MNRSKTLQSLRTLLFILNRENFFYILGITFFVLLCGTVSFYFLERGGNKAVESIGSAVYWAFISMTTTGYGDISPSTAGGRGSFRVFPRQPPGPSPRSSFGGKGAGPGKNPHRPLLGHRPVHKKKIRGSGPGFLREKGPNSGRSQSAE